MMRDLEIEKSVGGISSVPTHAGEGILGAIPIFHQSIVYHRAFPLEADRDHQPTQPLVVVHHEVKNSQHAIATSGDTDADIIGTVRKVFHAHEKYLVLAAWARRTWQHSIIEVLPGEYLGRLTSIVVQIG